MQILGGFELSTSEMTHRVVTTKLLYFILTFGEVHLTLPKYLYYSDDIVSTMASQITGLPIVCSTISSGTDHRICQRSASLAFMRGIHRWLVDSPHKRPITRKIFPFDDVIVNGLAWNCVLLFFVQLYLSFSTKFSDRVHIVLCLRAMDGLLPRSHWWVNEIETLQ